MSILQKSPSYIISSDSPSLNKKENGLLLASIPAVTSSAPRAPSLTLAGGHLPTSTGKATASVPPPPHAIKDGKVSTCWRKRSYPVGGIGCMLNRRWKSPICDIYKERITYGRSRKERAHQVYSRCGDRPVGVLHHTVSLVHTCLRTMFCLTTLTTYGRCTGHRRRYNGSDRDEAAVCTPLCSAHVCSVLASWCGARGHGYR